MKKRLLIFGLIIIGYFSQAQYIPVKPNFTPPKPIMFNNYYYPNINLNSLKPKYNYHKGIILLKDGTRMEGSIRMKNFAVLYKNEDHTYPSRIASKKIQKVTLKGAGYFVKYRQDSTELFWFNGYNKLFRKIVEGKISMYDNSYNIDEIASLPKEYMRICKTSDKKYIELKDVTSLNLLIKDFPYIFEVGKIIGKLNSDFYALQHLIEIYNSKDPVEFLKWDSITIVKNTGEEIKGKGIIHPLNQNVNKLPKNAYVHIFSDNKFNLYDDNSIENIIIDNEEYYSFFYKYKSINVFAKKVIIDDKEYYVTHLFPSKSNFLVKPLSKNGSKLLFLKKNKNNKLTSTGKQKYLQTKYIQLK